LADDSEVLRCTQMKLVARSRLSNA